MWKPGTAKPNDATPKSQNNASAVKSPKTTGGASKSKKLSNSTMGMRFMQRKNEAKNKEQEERKAFQQQQSALALVRTSDNRNHTTNNNDSVMPGNDANMDRKRVNGDISKDEQQQSASSDGGAIILQLASVVDIYGVGSDVVGRRSFGGFRKPVRTAYDAALKRRTEEDARTRNTKSHITDQELLERYEKYVRGGRGGGSEGGGSGNRGRKDKRKR
mmetsp:Transcript_10083/g.21275  ORF Transcript_10083/g.21275 Transcript_10083/m.21275 type:complete len:217 (+) Transcript_10083:366-1016(+)